MGIASLHPSDVQYERDMSAPARPSRIPHADKAAALALTPVSRETEARLDRYVELLVAVAGQDQSGRAIDPPASLDPARRRFAAAAGPRAGGQDLGRSRQRRRLSRRGAGLRAGRDAGRHGPSGRAQRQEGGLSARGGARNLLRQATVHLAGIGDNVDRIGDRRRLRHRAGAGSATSAYRFRGTACESGRQSLVSQGPRCRGRIDRSH